jgi:hypothetical protein
MRNLKIFSAWLNQEWWDGTVKPEGKKPPRRSKHTYGLFSNAVCISDYTALNGTMNTLFWDMTSYSLTWRWLTFCRILPLFSLLLQVCSGPQSFLPISAPHFPWLVFSSTMRIEAAHHSKMSINIYLSRIWGFHISGYKDFHLLGCNTV